MAITDQYNGWEIFNEIPSGWRIDKTVGSPLTRHVFITNGKSILNGGKRALLFVRPAKTDAVPQAIKQYTEASKIKTKQNIDTGYRRTVNDLARFKFQEKLLKDILVDLMICELEGWCKKEYIHQLQSLISNIAV